MRIKVTQDHIRRGLKSNRYSCPIALALNEAGVVGASVDNYAVVTSDGSFHALPTVAAKFIFAFDAGKQVEPLEFDIEGLEVEK